MRKKLMGGEGLHASGSMVKIDLPKENVYGEKICKKKPVGLFLGLWVMVQKVELTRVMAMCTWALNLEKWVWIFEPVVRKNKIKHI